jgi:hypothetical protein
MRLEMTRQGTTSPAVRGDPEAEAARAELRVRGELVRTRAELRDSLTALKGAIRVYRDWRAWVRARPLEAFAGALAFGFWLGSRHARR